MDLRYISLEKKDRVAIAWLNKPKANTYDADLMKDLSAVVDDVRFDDNVDVCVLASKLDGIWSAGADINLLATSTPDYKAMFCLDCQETLNKLESTPKLFIAAIDGHCVGGGLEIAMSTDLRVASDGAWRIGLPEVTLGVLPGTGGTQRLPRLIGKSRAIDLMATSRAVTFPGRSHELRDDSRHSPGPDRGRRIESTGQAQRDVDDVEGRTGPRAPRSRCRPRDADNHHHRCRGQSFHCRRRHSRVPRAYRHRTVADV